MVEHIHPDPTRNETVVAENVSFDEFLTHYAEQHAEWLMGKVILIVSNNTPHQMIQGFLFNILSLYLGFKSLGKVLLAGVPMYLGDNQPAREPDLLVILNENLEFIKVNRLEGPADIAVEIVSPESSTRDWGDKMAEYEAAGVKEYLLVDLLRTEAVIWELGDDGHYHRRAVDTQGRVTSGLLPGFALDPTLLWRDDLPEGADLVALVQQMVGD